MPPDLRQRTEDLLADVDKQQQVDRFSGFVQTGVGYQSNPGGGPGPQTVLASGRSFDNRFFANGDGNWFGAFALNYVHDFENQRGDTFEASLTGYDAQQFSLHQLAFGTLASCCWPAALTLTPGSPNAISVKPYLIATGSLLADTIYSGSAGGGLTLHANVGNVAFDPFAEVVQQSFRNSTFYPLASNLSGTLSTVGLQASGPIASGLGWQARGVFGHSNAAFSPDSYDVSGLYFWIKHGGISRFLGDGRALDADADRGLQPCILCAGPDDRPEHDAAHQRMARRFGPRCADLEQDLHEHARAIPRRQFQRRGVHDARFFDLRRPDIQILEGACKF